MAEITEPSTTRTSPIQVSRAEFLWLSLGVWLGGIFILAVMPLLLVPRMGVPLGIATSYFVFFLAWQPVQTITQRALGLRAAVARMLLFVGAAATVAYYLRELLIAR